MQKPHKDNYTLVKAYRSIVLLDTIGKTFELILTKKISAISKIYYLLSNTHFKERKNISMEHAVHFLIKKTYATWDLEEKVSILMLDITRDFDNIS